MVKRVNLGQTNWVTLGKHLIKSRVTKGKESHKFGVNKGLMKVK